MTATGLDAFEAYRNRARLGKSQKYVVFCIMGSLHALQDRLTVQEGADLAAQLPLLVKGIFYDG